MKQRTIESYFTTLNAPEMSEETAMDFHEQTKWNATNYCEFHRSFVTHLSDERALTEPSHNWKNYFGCKQTILPPPKPNQSTFQDIITRRTSRRRFAGQAFSSQDLSNLLAALRCYRRVSPVGHPKITYNSTPYASGGGLYPVETYLLHSTDEENSQFDLSYYNPVSHSLYTIKTGIPRETAKSLVNDFDEEFTQGWSCIFFFSATFRRTMAKYGTSGYRMALIEVGEVAQQIALSLEANDFGGVLWSGIFDDVVNDFLEIDGRIETTILSLIAGKLKT